MSLIGIKKDYILIWLSVIIYTLVEELGLAIFLYISDKKLRRSLTPNDWVTTICYSSYPTINADNLARDCLPLPPTPTSSAWPAGSSIIRVILQTCYIAWSNKTKFIWALTSLY